MFSGLLTFLFLTGVSFAAGPSQPTIQEITVSGAHRIETAAIMARLQSAKGTPLKSDVVRQDIQQLFHMGFFDSVDAYEEDMQGGKRLIFEVKEKPVVLKIEYEGIDAIEKNDLKDIILIKEFEVLDQGKLKQSVERLSAKYEEKGFYLAEIRNEVKVDEERSEATVTFKVSENDKIQVKAIDIVGNEQVSDEELKEIMQTKEGGPFSWMTQSGSYREAIFERDIEMIKYYYGTLGYVKAQVGRPEVTVSADKRSLYLAFHVTEGEKYNVGKVDFSGDLLFSRDELRADLKLITGEQFNTDVLRRETLRYADKYADLGYAYANVIPQYVVHDDTKTVDVTFEVERGERVYIGRIIITGNTRTKDRVIRRELKIHEGELFNGTKKRESRENVVRLGYFDNVEFHQSTAPSAHNVVDIEIKVKERSTGQLMVAMGFGSTQGFMVQAQLQQNNFLGNGQVASLNVFVLTGTNLYQFGLGFQEPQVGASLWSMGGDLYQTRRDVVSNLATASQVKTFDETRTGFRYSLGHPIVPFSNLTLSYNLENTFVPATSIIDKQLIDPLLVNGLKSSISGKLEYDKRDDRMDPRNGWYTSFSTEIAGLGGDRNFLKGSAAYRFYYNFLWDLVFRFNFTLGSIAPLGDKELPVSELFVQGGMMSLRGYPWGTVGPKATLNSNDSGFLSEDAKKANLGGKEVVIGGHNEVMIQMEVEFPLIKEARIRGVFFLDAGNAYNGFFENAAPALVTNFGWGIRWFTPIGPLRFEIGYPMVYGGPPQPNFSIGPPF